MKALAAGADPNHRIYNQPLFCVAANTFARSERQDAAFNVVRALLDKGVAVDACQAARRKILEEKPRIRNSGQQPLMEDALALLDRAMGSQKKPAGAAPPQASSNQELAVVPQATTSTGSRPLGVWEKLKFSEDFSDVKFVCEDNEGVLLPAHKCVLAAASPYFNACLKDPNWEKEHPNGVWKTQHPFPVLKAVLDYIYTEKLEPVEAVLEEKEYQLATLEVAVEYQLPILQGLAEGHLKNCLSLETLKDTLLAANQCNSEFLKQACFGWVRQNAASAMFEPSIMSLAQEDEALWKELAEAVRGGEIRGRKRQKTSHDTRSARARLGEICRRHYSRQQLV